MFKKPVHWIMYGGIWVLMGLYYTTWDMLAYHMPVLSVLPMNLLQNAVWALEGLVILRVARRFPIQSFSLKGLPAWIINLGTGFVLACLGLGIAWLISLAFQEPAMRAKVLQWPWKNLLRFFFTYFHSTLLLMWAVLGGFHGFLLYKGMKARELEAAQLEASLTLARNQMLLAQFQPHFLFNALNSISALIHTDPLAADRMVARLGDLLRLNLDAEASQELPLEKEMALVDAFLAIEKVRFQDRLEVEVDIPPDLAKAPVPKFLLQPLVENALKHGLAPRARPGKLLIRATREAPWLTLEVQDNGAGFEGTREGVGLRNTRARLLMLYHENQRLEIFSVPDKGTRVVVRIPLH
ncbi:MAG: histidine kinase [Holophaga sp.]|nr:histidine kinase [Holophaga sp.]